MSRSWGSSCAMARLWTRGQDSEFCRAPPFSAPPRSSLSVDSHSQFLSAASSFCCRFAFSLFIRVLILGASSLHPHIIWIVEHPFMRICVSVPCIMYLYLTASTTYCCPTHHPCCRTLPSTLYPPPTCSSIALLLTTLPLRASIKWNGVPFAGTYTRTCGLFELAADSMVSSFVGTWYAGQAEPWRIRIN